MGRTIIGIPYFKKDADRSYICVNHNNVVYYAWYGSHIELEIGQLRQAVINKTLCVFHVISKNDVRFIHPATCAEVIDTDH